MEYFAHNLRKKIKIPIQEKLEVISWELSFKFMIMVKTRNPP